MRFDEDGCCRHCLKPCNGQPHTTGCYECGPLPPTPTAEETP